MKWYLAILIMLILASCKKDPIQYTFEGNVNYIPDQQALSGVAVEVSQKLFNNSVSSSNFSFAGSSTTDASGNYSISFARDKATEFKVIFKKDGYYKEEILLYSTNVTADHPNVVDTGMDAQSWVQFHVQNAVPSSQTDEIKLVFYTYRTGCENCIEQDYNIINGIVDSTITYSNTADQYLKFTVFNVTGGQTFTDSVYMTPFDTVNYEIIY
ncbi:hypothetical protein K6119_01290 [Paracrocinitomix mangrovi]|uniref:hypothetical protein n=1 Tax=Paracrocinitomix mangrovi TaxID=2862509 RepID=UPI001C8CF474|nr:hypothetical protein [Paracrocinitomix mangrovi]UKN02150.1 hypothetical protein K6119_01290 [Paracrocinitomix mangrovi]